MHAAKWWRWCQLMIPVQMLIGERRGNVTFFWYNFLNIHNNNQKHQMNQRKNHHQHHDWWEVQEKMRREREDLRYLKFLFISSAHIQDDHEEDACWCSWWCWWSSSNRWKYPIMIVSQLFINNLKRNLHLLSSFFFLLMIGTLVMFSKLLDRLTMLMMFVHNSSSYEPLVYTPSSSFSWFLSLSPRLK